MRENRFLQWCKWRRLEVPTGPWIGCPRPLANFPKAFAPVQWATCQRLLCGYACSSVREHSASVRVGLFQRPASTRSRTRMPSRASSLGDCQRWTLASSSCLAQHPPWSTATAAKRRFKKALAVTTHHHPLASPRRWRRGARQAQRPPARLLHRSPAACSPGSPWAGQLFFFSSFNWTKRPKRHTMAARVMLQSLTFALCAIFAAGVWRTVVFFSLIFVWWRDHPLPSPLDTRERERAVRGTWHPSPSWEGLWLFLTTNCRLQRL